jgi:hypothetical protein
MAGHKFEPLFVDPSLGSLTVRWDGSDDKRMTCRIPLSQDGSILPPDDFKKSIMEQCLQQLELWDQVAVADLASIDAYLGQTIDVTEDYILRNVKE